MGSNQQPSEIRDTARKVRQAIVAGEFNFTEAAARYSAAPTADKGGEVGWISRHEPMSPEFNKAAFQLSPNQLSQPVVSLVGVHLIYCLEVKPGQRTWQEARAELIAAVRQYLFHWLADRERTRTTVELVPQSDDKG